MKAALRILAGAVLAVTLAGCHASPDSGGHVPDFQLKLYHVPPQQSQNIAKNLSAVLESSDYLVGSKAHTEMSVTQPFPGSVLVLAPASLQSSIGSAIKELAQTSRKPSASALDSDSLKVSFWVVQAKAGLGEDAAALHPLETALKQVRETLGPSHFVLEDIASALVDAPVEQNLAAGNGNIVTSRGHTFGFHVTAPVGADIGLEVNYGNTTADAASHTIPELKTTVAVRTGEYVVLAQASPSASSAGASDKTLMNLLVVRVDRTSPASH